MKKTSIIIIIILVFIAVMILWGVSAYNGLVSSEETVNKQWANVESQYQRRADLIPNLVATVKGYAEHESSTLESVVAARARATQVTVDANSLTPENMQAYQEAQGELSAALGRLLMITENYPDLKANENFKELQAELAGTENRISVERMRFNEMAQNYNTSIRRFPKNIIASLFGFKQKPYFASNEGADVAPRVEF